MQELLRLGIIFEGADGQVQHAPLVHGTVGDRATRFVLDTGSDVHLLTEGLADDLGLEKVPGEEGVDHGGATMPSWSVGSVGLDLGGTSLTLHDVVVIPAPRPFDSWGVGGILAPQLLHPTAAAVIDLARHELILIDGSDDELEAHLSDRSPDLTLLRLPRDAPVGNVVVPAAIAGAPEVPTLVDTGGKRTEASMSTVVGLVAGSSETLGRGVGGNEFAGASAGRQALVVGVSASRSPTWRCARRCTGRSA